MNIVNKANLGALFGFVATAFAGAKAGPFLSGAAITDPFGGIMFALLTVVTGGAAGLIGNQIIGRQDRDRQGRQKFLVGVTGGAVIAAYAALLGGMAWTLGHLPQLTAAVAAPG